jgi:hypothetical protein
MAYVAPVEPGWVEVFAHTRFASAAMILGFSVFAAACVYGITRYAVLTARTLHRAVVDAWPVLASAIPRAWRWMMKPMDPANPADMALPLIVAIYMMVTWVTVVLLSAFYMLYCAAAAAFPAGFGLAEWTTFPLLALTAVFVAMLKVSCRQMAGTFGVISRRWELPRRGRP